MRLLPLVAASTFLIACGSNGIDPAGSAESAGDAVTAGQDGYYELASGSAAATYVRAVNGGTMVCANGKTASTCLARVDWSSLAGPDGVLLDSEETTSAAADFAASSLIIRASFVFVTGEGGKKTKVLEASQAWKSMAGAMVNSGVYAVRSSGVKCAAGATCDQFVESKLNGTTSHGLVDIDFASDLHLSSSAQADAISSVFSPGALVRGHNHEIGSKWTLVADEWLVRLTHVAPTSGLSADQETALLHVIDSKCGDTWCDGDYNFRFDAITCDFTQSSCTMTLAAISPEYDGKPSMTYPETCTISGVSSFAFMVSTSPTGYTSLTQDAYPAVDACMQSVMSKLPPV